jgi:hypothetical protein
VKEEEAVCGWRGGGDAFEAGEFGRAGGIGDEPGFEAGRENVVVGGGEVNEFALGEKQEEADAEVGEDNEEQDFWEERFGDDGGERHGENDQIPNAKYQRIVDEENVLRGRAVLVGKARNDETPDLSQCFVFAHCGVFERSGDAGARGV